MKKRMTALLLASSAALAAMPVLPAEAAWPGTNGDIVYSTRVGFLGLDRDIYRSSSVPLTPGPQIDTTPFWAPPGSANAGRIAFVRRADRSGDAEIWVMEGDGSGAVNVSNEPTVNNLNPAWSRDGAKILYTRPEGAKQQIWIMDANGMNKHAVFGSPTNFNDTEAVWSPTGADTLAFVRDNGTHTQQLAKTTKIHTVGIDPGTGLATGTPVQRSPDDTGTATCTSGRGCTWSDDQKPDWSPNGQRIAFDRKNQSPILSGRHIYTMSAGGGGEVQITRDPFFLTGNSVEPAYSPDGTQIVFSVKGLAPPESVVKLSASGGGTPTPLPAQAPRFNDQPNWGPGGPAAVVPETRLAVLLPVGAALLMVALVLVPRRRRAPAWA